MSRRDTERGGRRALVASSLLMIVGIFLWASPAAAGWTYSPTCGGQSKTRSFDLLQSQAYIMLDKSGSMGGNNKWWDAEDAINAAVGAKTDPYAQDVVQFGLGLFSSTDYNKVSPQEDADGPIRTVLANNGPGGGTYMGQAIRRSKNTLLAEPQASRRPQATIFITDGYPSDNEETIIDRACEHRNQVGPLYSVGFGSGTDQQFNNMMAAAGGTGYCCKGGGSCTQSNTSNHADPCASGADLFTTQTRQWCHWHYSWFSRTWTCHSYTTTAQNPNWECHGAEQVSGGTGLKSVISGITNDLACRVDADSIWDKKYSDKAYGCSTDNYECLDISFGLTDVSYNPSNPNGDGWRWVDENTQETISLNENTCNEIEKSYTSNSVTVERACMCGNKTPGKRCTNTGAQNCECTTGTVSCNQSFADCTPDVQCPDSARKGFGGTCQEGTGVCIAKGEVFCTAQGFACGKKTGMTAKRLGEAGLKGGMSGASWRTVALNSGNFSTRPVVLSTPQTTNGGSDPSEAHVSTVTRGGFNVQHCELDIDSKGNTQCDGHASETLGWLALDPSEVNNTNGMRAGTFASSSGTEAHDSFNFGTTFSNRPLVFASAQTRKGGGVPRNTQIVSVSKTSATVEFCKQDSADGCGYHGSEDIGWLAIDPKNANLKGIDAGEFMTGDSGWKRISFSSAFPQTPVVIADVQTENGGSEALYPEVTNVTTTGADIRFCESDGANDCDTHADERVAWVAFVPGDVEKQNNSNFTPIKPPPPPTTDEKACDGKDNDCDGQIDEGSTEICDGVDNDCDGLVDEVNDQSCMNSNAEGRCKAGTKSCNKSTGKFGSCVSKRRPLPEICNGLDDDCDGIVDNIKQSWEKSLASGITVSDLTEKQRGRVCGKVGACNCGPNLSGADTQHRAPSQSPMTADAEFDYMVKNTQTTCYCKE